MRRLVVIALLLTGAAQEPTQVGMARDLLTSEGALVTAERALTELDALDAAATAEAARQAAAFGPLLAFAARRATAPFGGLLGTGLPAGDAARGMAIVDAMAAGLHGRTLTLAAARDASARARAVATAARDAVLAQRAAQRAAAAALDRSIARARAAAPPPPPEPPRVAVAQAAARAPSLPAAVAIVARPVAAVAAAPGRWAIPVSGARTGGFGAATDSGPATGVRIAVPPGARVVSPCDGRVAFAAPFRSYGGLVIVACADGMHAVMSGLDRIDLQLGQGVRAGSPAGVMPHWDPDHPPADRPALTLQAVRDGTPVDPAPLLR